MEKFRDIEYKRPDIKRLRSDLKEAVKNIKNAKSYTAAKAAFLKSNGLFETAATMVTVASIRNSVNTSDTFYEEEMKFLDKSMVMLAPLMKKLNKALVESPFASDFAAEYGDIFIKDMETDIRTQNNKILSAKIKQSKLVREYSKLTSSCRVEFQGETCNFYGLLKYMQSTDREVRKAAFEQWAKLYEGIAPQLDGIYDKLIALRVGIAKKLKFDDYIDLTYLSRGRYDYTKQDVEKFRNAVRDYIVPVCAKLYEEKRLNLGLEQLHFYDESLDYADGNPVPQGTPDELVEAARRMYSDLSPETGEFFDFMTRFELFDLITNNNKRLGGYCTSLPGFKAPFIFSNFNGTSADVDVLTHEAGHAFEYYIASRTLPIIQQQHSTSEINEIHSMAMEHFAYPYMELFFGENADKYRRAHLASALCTIPYLVSVDEFQHRVYEKPNMTAAERYAVWKKIEETYLPWRDYDGNEFLEKGGFWMQKQHIFMYPFYYIEYALAQMCAFQLFIKMRINPVGAWQDYLRLCKAGGSKGYFQLLELAGLQKPFEPELIQSVTKTVASLLNVSF